MILAGVYSCFHRLAISAEVEIDHYTISSREKFSHFTIYLETTVIYIYILFIVIHNHFNNVFRAVRQEKKLSVQNQFTDFS